MADSVQWLSQSDYSICISVLVEFYNVTFTWTTERTTCEQLHQFGKYCHTNTPTTLVQPPLQRPGSRSGRT